MTTVTRKRIGDVLIEHGVLSREQLETALDAQSAAPEGRRRLGQVVVDLGLASEGDVASALGAVMGLEVVDLLALSPEPEEVRRLPQMVAERSGVVVVGKSGNRLVVATADPTNVLALDDVRLYTGAADLDIRVATDGAVRETLRRAWSLAEDQLFSGVTEDLAPSTDDPATVSEDDAPTVRLANRILQDAVRQGASDIHIEPQRDGVRVRFRVDGLLREIMRIPRSQGPALVSRIKIISGLDIGERRVPQDGRTRIVADAIAVDSRVSTLPSLFGEKIVIRLLALAERMPTLDEIGMTPRDLGILKRALSVPQGLVLITGPTGSGKTNTLYAGIAEISTPVSNIVTLEDPVEVQMPGITQVQVHERAGMTFQKGLRSILRQDPDIVLVGEVRDSETSELALKAALTGHLVLTTLHTNSAAAALTRLVDMGAEPFLVASSLSCVVAQRLARKPCVSCSEPYEPEPALLASLGLTRDALTHATPRKGRGCARCGHTGYKGRTGVFEVLEVDTAMRAVLLTTPTETAVTATALASGMVSLRAAAVEKARAGLITFEEAARVTHSDRDGGPTCPGCRRAVKEDMVVCPWCETSLDAGHCRGCGKPLEAEWTICPWCRTHPEDVEPA